MSNRTFSDMRPSVTAMAEATIGGTSRTQQVLMTCVFSAAQTQFSFTRGLLEDMGEAFQAGKAVTNPIEAAQTLLSRVHDRTERTIADMRRINDELRSSLYETASQQLSKTSTVLSATAEKAADATRAPAPAPFGTPAAPTAKR